MSQIARIPSTWSRSRERALCIRLSWLSPIGAIIDFALVALCGEVAAACDPFDSPRASLPFDAVTGPSAVASAAFVLSARARGLYEAEALSRPREVWRRPAMALAAAGFALIVASRVFTAWAAYPRGALLLFPLFAALAVPAGRWALGAAIQFGIREGRIRRRRTITLGRPGEFEGLGPGGLSRFGIDERERIVLLGSSGALELSEPERAQVARSIEIARHERAVEFALLIPWSESRIVSEIGAILGASPLPVRLYPDRWIRALAGAGRDADWSRPLAITLQREPLTGLERLCKRSLDLAVAGWALLILSPLMAGAAIAIKLDSPGPVIFRQRRRGFDDSEFVIYKFRTMRVLDDGGVVVQARRADDRITRVGALLRRSSLDELPQLVNVLRGEMSIVGPRPHAVAHDDIYKTLIDNYSRRGHVKPGLTGAAQIMGLRGETPDLARMQQRVDRDIWYIGNWSITLDLRIMFLTCFALFRNEAY